MQYNINIFASFAPTAISDGYNIKNDIISIPSYINMEPTVQTCALSSHEDWNKQSLKITSNGITPVFPVKFCTQPINFVVQLIDSKGFDVKDHALLTDVELYLSATSSIPSTFTTQFGPLSTLTQGGFYKGTVTSTLSATNVAIVAILTSFSPPLTGRSSSFDILPLSGDSFDVRKINEDFDNTAALKSLAIQPALLESDNLFDDLLGPIVGDGTKVDDLGTSVYEKIANFVMNTKDIDYCTVEQLKSLLDSINANYDDDQISYPSSLQRLVDILSVNYNRLQAKQNQFKGNFDTKGFVNKETYGKNRGNELDFFTTTLSASSSISPGKIIAYEKFSKTYQVLNTNLTHLSTTYTYTTTANNVSAYPLSAYNANWGWNLVVPPGSDIPTYYVFYLFTDVAEGSYINSFVDYDNTNNTFSAESYDEFVKTGGVIDTMLIRNLYSNLNVITGINT